MKRGEIMLTVKVKETGKIVNLSLIDRKTNCDYVADFIGNTGAFEREFERLEDETGAMYAISQEDLDWWENVIALQEKSDALQAKFLESHDYGELLDLLEQVGATDLDTRLEAEIELVNEALDV